MKISAVTNGGARLRSLAETRGLKWLALAAVMSLVAGCSANGTGQLASQQGFGPTVAFESVDGPPPQVFDRLLQALQSEGASRNISVVSREGQASYRVKSYYAAQVHGGSTRISWVWDVYDSGQQRAVRLSGVEPAGKASRDAWAAADDRVLRRISEAGLNGLTGLINGTPPTDQPAAPAVSGPAVASVPAESIDGDSATNSVLAFSAH